MQKLRYVFAAVGILLVFVIGLFLGVYGPRLLGAASSLRTYSTATIIRQVQTVSQLVTVKYVIEKVEVLEDAKWFGDNRVLLVAHGIVTAGVDLSKLGPGDVQISGQTITLRLPAPQIMDTYLDDKQTYVVERTTGLLRSFDKDLEQTARQHAVDDIGRAARQNGILKDAKDRAEMQLRLLFTEMGYNVEFRDQ